MKIMIFGAKGMLGHTLFEYLSSKDDFEVYGTSRRDSDHNSIIGNIDILDIENVKSSLSKVSPDIVLNAIGVIKQKKSTNYELECIKVNSLWPRELEALSKDYGFKVIHFSTDCVFTGAEGGYYESDTPNAKDVYGLTKYLGEIQSHNSLTLRTSIIGHELDSSVSLIDWFLGQKGSIKGFSKAVFSGFPTIYIAKFLDEFILRKHKDLSGLYHLSSEPINKYDLLNLVAKVYKKEIEINKDSSFQIDRSLNSSKLRGELGWEPPSWEDLIQMMYEHRSLVS